jgi:RNA polymerase sigma factor (sigma-70 family)
MKQSDALPESNAAHDLELMQRLKTGDDLALNELMSGWQTPLVGFILRYTGNEQDALDLAQETFVRVYESRHRYQPTAKFSTWLLTIAINLCRNLARWRDRHPSVALDATDDDDKPSLGSLIPAAGDSPSDSAERDDLASAMREQMRCLTISRRWCCSSSMKTSATRKSPPRWAARRKPWRRASIAPASSCARAWRDGKTSDFGAMHRHPQKSQPARSSSAHKPARHHVSEKPGWRRIALILAVSRSRPVSALKRHVAIDRQMRPTI